MKRIFLALLAFGGIAYAAISGYMAWNQQRLIFRIDPDIAPVAVHSLPRAADVSLAMADGTVLRGWRIEPATPQAPVFLYFHGNARNLSRRADRFRVMTEDGSGLIAFHYRGYGGSDGAPDEALLHADAAEIYADALRRYPGNPVVIFGESLGSSVATRLASEKTAKALVLDSPFYSMLDRAWTMYPWLPVPLLLRHTFRSDLWMPRVATPVLVLHGEADRIVPVAEGRRLFTLAREPKQMIAYPEAGHVGAFYYGAAGQIRAFLKAKAGL